MAHDESGSLADYVPPGIRALDSDARAQPGAADRAATYALGVVTRREQAGWWGGEVWEHLANYKGAVALAIQPYIDYFLGAKYTAYRKRKGGPVRKALAGGYSKYSRDDGYEPLEDDHPVSRILREPGGEDGAYTLGFELAFGYLQNLITGSAPFWMPRNGDGKPCQFYALTAAHLQVASPPGAHPSYPQGSYRILPASQYGWTTSGPLTQAALLPAEEVRILRRVHPLSRHWGMSPMQLGAKQIDLLNAIVDFQWNYFNEGVALDTIITVPGADADTCQRIREDVLRKHAGARRGRSLGVFGGAAGMEGGKGATVQSLAPAPKEMDYERGYEAVLQQVMAFFGTPKLLAGFGDASNYATYIGQLRMFRDMRLKPAFEMVSEFLTRHIANQWEEDGEEIVIAAEPQIPKDEEQEQQELQSALQSGAITVNEYRLATGRDPYDNGDLPLSVYVQVKQQEVAPPPQPGADPNAPPGAEPAAPVPGDEGGASEEPGAIPDEQGDDSEEGTQEAATQAALAALGMGGTDAGPEDDAPVQKAASPVNKPGGASRPKRQEGETWTGSDGKKYTRKNGKDVLAPSGRGSGTGGPGASASRPAGQSAPAPAQPQQQPSAGGVKPALHPGGRVNVGALLKDPKYQGPTGRGDPEKLSRAVTDRVAGHLAAGGTVTAHYGARKVPIVAIKDGMMQDAQGQRWGMLALASEGANGGVEFHPPAGASNPSGSGTAAAPPQDRAKYHAQILKVAGKGAKAIGLTPERLAQMHPSAVDTIAAQLGIKPPEEHYAPHAATVPVTPRNKSHLERAHEWADSMAQKHAARVAQHLGIRPEHAQRILAKAIRQVAEHALKNGGKASGTLSVGGRNLRVGVGSKTGAGAAPVSKPPTPESLGFGATNPADRKRPKPGVAKAMNTLSDPDGGFLVPAAGSMPRRKRKRRSVCAIVRKALEGVA